MKRTSIFFALVASLSIMIMSCGSKGTNGITYKDAKQYNDYIVTKQLSLQQSFMKAASVLGAVSNPAELKAGAAKLLQTIDSLLPVVKKDITDVQGMPDWKGDTLMRSTAVKLFTFYETVLNKDMRDMGTLLSKGENFTPADEQKIQDINTRVNSDEAKYDSDFLSAQKQFAQKNKLLLY